RLGRRRSELRPHEARRVIRQPEARLLSLPRRNTVTPTPTPPPEPPKSQAVQILAMCFGFATTALCIVLLALEKKLGFEDATHSLLVGTVSASTVAGGVGAFLFQRGGK